MITVNPATWPGGWLMEEEGIYNGPAIGGARTESVAKDEAITIHGNRAQAVTFGDLLVSSYSAGNAPEANADQPPIGILHSQAESVEKDESHFVRTTRPFYFILPTGDLLFSSDRSSRAADANGLRPAAIDRVMVDWGDGQMDAILHEDNEFSFPRMITARADSANHYSVWLTAGVVDPTNPDVVYVGGPRRLRGIGVAGAGAVVAPAVVDREGVFWFD
jgi:hypothetical protein